MVSVGVETSSGLPLPILLADGFSPSSAYPLVETESYFPSSAHFLAWPLQLIDSSESERCPHHSAFCRVRSLWRTSLTMSDVVQQCRVFYDFSKVQGAPFRTVSMQKKMIRAVKKACRNGFSSKEHRLDAYHTFCVKLSEPYQQFVLRYRRVWHLFELSVEMMDWSNARILVEISGPLEATRFRPDGKPHTDDR